MTQRTTAGVPAAFTVAIAVAANLLGACGEGKAPGTPADGETGGKERAGQMAGGAGGSMCSEADTTPVSLATRDFITKASPSAQRFLSAAGTDSALPDDGFKVLQDKGPTFFYSSDSVAQRKIREKLAADGPYASLLVVYRGQTPTDGGNGVDIRLGGHYIGGTLDGKLSPTKRYAIKCDSTGWRIASTAEEPGS